MQEFRLRDGDEFIKLGQLLKAVGLVSSGSEARMVIENGEVLVNGAVECRRGKKMHDQDVAEFQGEKVKVVSRVYSVPGVEEL